MNLKRSATKAVGLMALVQALACGQPPAGPSRGPASLPDSSGLPATPDTGTSISGIVGEPAFRGVAGARIEVLDGPDAGTWTTSHASGVFGFRARADQNTRFRATKAGYLDGTTTLAMHPTAPPGLIWFVLAPVAPPVNVAGDYTLTFIAGDTCTMLPSELRTRSYVATIAPDSSDPRYPAGTTFRANILGVTAVPGREYLPVGVAGNVVAVLLGEDGWPYFAEQLPSDTYYAPDGRVSFETGTSPIGTLSAQFHGWIAHGRAAVTNSPSAAAVCESSTHRLVMTRR